MDEIEKRVERLESLFKCVCQRTSNKTLADEAILWDEGKIDPKTWDDTPEALPRHSETESISLRLPKTMLAIIKEMARREGLGYQTLIKQWLDEKILDLRYFKTKGEPSGKGK